VVRMTRGSGVIGRGRWLVRPEALMLMPNAEFTVDRKLSNSRSIFHSLPVPRSLPLPHSPSPFPSLSSRQIRPAAPLPSRWIQAGSRPARHRRRAPPPLPPSSRAPLPSLSRLSIPSLLCLSDPDPVGGALPPCASGAEDRRRGGAARRAGGGRGTTRR